MNASAALHAMMMFEGWGTFIARVAVAFAIAAAFYAIATIVFLAVYVGTFGMFFLQHGRALSAAAVLVGGVLLGSLLALGAVQWLTRWTRTNAMAIAGGYLMGAFAGFYLSRTELVNHPALGGSQALTAIFFTPYLGAFVGALFRTRDSRVPRGD